MVKKYINTAQYIRCFTLKKTGSLHVQVGIREDIVCEFFWRGRKRTIWNLRQSYKARGKLVWLLASVLPMNIQDWFPLGLTGWISLQSKGFSRAFSNTTVQKHQPFCTQLSLWSNSQHPYMTTGKTIALTRWTFVSKVMSLLFNMSSMLLLLLLSCFSRVQLCVTP